MAVVGEMEYEVWYQSLAVVALGCLAALVSERFLCIKLLAFFEFQVFE